MRSRFAALIAGLAIALAAAGVATVGTEDGAWPLSTTRNGSDQIPAPGHANITSAGHIHVASVGASRPVEVPLPAGTDGASGCVQDVDPSLIKAIHKHPFASYGKVRCTEFPDR